MRLRRLREDIRFRAHTGNIVQEREEVNNFLLKKFTFSAWLWRTHPATDYSCRFVLRELIRR